MIPLWFNFGNNMFHTLFPFIGIDGQPCFVKEVLQIRKLQGGVGSSNIVFNFSSANQLYWI